MKKLTILFTIAMFLVTSTSFSQCDAGEIEVSISVSTDDWGYEVYWELLPEGNNCGDGTIASGGNNAVGCNGGGDQNQTPGGYDDNVTVVEGPWCLMIGESYDLFWADDWGDGGATFIILVGGIEIYEFVGSGNGNSWTFEVNEPPALDAAVIDIESYSYVTDANAPAIGTALNMGLETMTEVELQVQVNGGAAVTETFDGLSVASNEMFEFEFSSPMGLQYGENQVEVSVLSVNGGTDEVPSNDSFSKTVELGNSIPNVIDGYLDQNVELVSISNGANLNAPRDLDFHPVLTRFELWVINKETENSGGSTVRFENAGMDDQWDEYEEDGNAWHFMSLPTGIAFGENENFGTSPGVFDANHDGGMPFTGPSLWSSEDDIYAEPSGGNGSHLDMLHVSPNSQGIAHEIDNVYWVVDGYNEDIVRYDFADDHGPGNSFHGDAIIRRYADFSITKDPANHIVSHCVLDKNSGWLYVVDHGEERVLRLDINSGSIGGTPSFGPFESIVEYSYVVDYDWEVIIDQDLVEPAGIEIIGNRLLVSDHSNGDIIVYDTDNNFEEIGRINTEPGVMGIKVGPWGRIWYVNATTDDVGFIGGNPLATQEINQDLGFNLYPNPVKDDLQLELNIPVAGAEVTIVDQTGRQLYHGLLKPMGTNTIDTSNFAVGMYVVSVQVAGSMTSSVFVKQ